MLQRKIQAQIDIAETDSICVWDSMREKWYARIPCSHETSANLVRRQFLASKGKPQLKTRADAGIGQGIYALPSFRDRIKSKAHGEAAHRTLSIAKIWLFAGRYAQNACLLLIFRRLSTAPKWALEKPAKYTFGTISKSFGIMSVFLWYCSEALFRKVKMVVVAATTTRIKWSFWPLENENKLDIVCPAYKRV